MKDLNITKQLFFLLLLIIGGSLKAQYHDESIFTPYKTNIVSYNGYFFSISPKSNEWKDKNHSQRIDALQLPNDTLQNISTLRLLETCLYYPLNIDAFMNDDVVAGFKKIKSQFNGYEELFGRDDFPPVLMELYSSRDVNFIEKIDNDYDRGQYSFDYRIMELMMHEILNEVSNQRSNQIVELVSEKQSQRENLKEYYGGNNIADRIINKSNQ